MTTQSPRYQEICHRLRELGQFCNGIVPTVIPLEPEPEELREPAEDLRLLASKVDAVIEAMGEYLRANSHDVDMSVFRNVVIDTIEGNATYEYECAAERLADDLQQQAYHSKHNHATAAE